MTFKYTRALIKIQEDNGFLLKSYTFFLTEDRKRIVDIPNSIPSTRIRV